MERVPVLGTMTCDLQASLGEETLLIEVKSARLDPTSLHRLRRGEHITVQRAIARSRDRSRRFKQASLQLASSATHHETALRVMWIRCMGPGGIAFSLESFCTLYGIRWYRIIASSTPLVVNIIPVFFADHAWFRSNPEVCAVVEEGLNGLSLRVNPFTSDRVALTQSALFRKVLGLGGVFDLESVRDTPGVYVVDCDGVTPGGAEVKASLRSKYGIDAEGTDLSAESTAWPGNELGGYSPVPGWDIGVPDLRWFT
ncbi:MAG: hypothetical protein HND58_04820 [Planctomycetota bacterium]|nr:MAG: hypothetical protein HND58_04820 [Planctomycetota bacterium]